MFEFSYSYFLYNPSNLLILPFDPEIVVAKIERPVTLKVSSCGENRLCRSLKLLDLTTSL
jgi:hypothetical protein